MNNAQTLYRLYRMTGFSNSEAHRAARRGTRRDRAREQYDGPERRLDPQRTGNGDTTRANRGSTADHARHVG